ncbi:MAG TPA: proton-conducting transporter membrane subunit, partial [Coriobacteriia bacterium]|nr:proton-conducting transporter membrane subunit [Coriobacteriia bacterium]
PPEISGGVILSGSGFSAAVGIICAAGAIIVLGGWGRVTARAYGGGLAALAGFGIAAGSMVATAADIIVVLLGLQIMAISAYVLVWSTGTPASTEAAVKYFVQGSVATGLLVLGIVILLGLYPGSSSLVAIRQAMGDDTGAHVTTAFVLIAAAFSFKMGAFPFHSWTLDVLETAPPHFAALLAGLPKFAAVVAMFIVIPRSVFAGLPAELLAGVLGAVAVLSMAFGATGGLLQASYTRMLAYSGVAHAGYALAGVAAGATAMTPTAVLAGSYALSAAAVFLAAGAFSAARPGWDGSVRGLAGIGRERPLLGIAVVVALLSLTGIPLTAGFWGKFLVFGLALDMGLWWLAAAGVAASVVSFGYYGAILRALYFESPPPAAAAGEVRGTDGAAEAVAVTLSLAVLALGVLPLITGLGPLLETLTFGHR